MKLKIIAIGLILVAACLSGCIGKDSIQTDTYRCTVDDGILYLHNGEYEMLIDEMHGGGGIYGEYILRDDLVLLKREFLGDIVQFVIDGRDLIDPDGDRWVRD
jgi:aminopeptidase-like protein